MAETLLRALIRDRHLTPFRAFEAAFAKAARDLAQREEDPALSGVTVSPRNLERWCSGHLARQPRPDACRVLEHMFGQSVRVLLAPPAPSGQPATVITDVGMAEPAMTSPMPAAASTGHDRAPTGAATSNSFDEDDMERRELLRLLGVTGLAAPLASGLHADTLRRRLDSALNAPTTRADVAEWERVAAQYSVESGIAPPAALLPELLTDLDEAQARLGGAPDSLRAPMARVCGYLGALAAMNYFNAGDERSANRYWRTALRMIDQSDDRSAQAELRAHRAMFVLLGAQPSPSAALTLADEAISVSRAGPCAGTANCYAARAQALALLGDHRESTRTLQDLADAFARMSGAQGSARSSWGYSEQSLRFIEGFVYAHAGRALDASQSLDAGRALIPDGQWIAITSFEVTRGLSLIRSGDPSEGARHVARAVQAMPASFRSSGATRRAALALDAVPANAAKLPAVTEARELLALSRGTVA